MKVLLLLKGFWDCGRLGWVLVASSFSAGLSRDTLRKLEQGELGVGFGAFLDVARVLGLGDQLNVAFDPYETDFGRARADQKLPQRVRR